MFLLEASRLQVKIGQEVLTDTILGEDFESGEQVVANVDGVVESVSMMGAEHAIYVVIKVDGDTTEWESDRIEG